MEAKNPKFALTSYPEDSETVSGYFMDLEDGAFLFRQVSDPVTQPIASHDYGGTASVIAHDDDTLLNEETVGICSLLASYISCSELCICLILLGAGVACGALLDESPDRGVLIGLGGASALTVLGCIAKHCLIKTKATKPYDDIFPKNNS
jgi:hypothetical protein